MSKQGSARVAALASSAATALLLLLASPAHFARASCEGESSCGMLKIKSNVSSIVMGSGDDDVSFDRLGYRDLLINSDVEIAGTLAIDGKTLQEIISEEVHRQLTGGGADQVYGSCQELYLDYRGNIADGVYDINVLGDTISVYCDMRNGGWTRVFNVLDSTPQSTYVNAGAVNAGSTSPAEMYKLSDDQINAIAAAAGSTGQYLHICADEVLFVGRTEAGGNWTSLRDQGGWMTDRDADGRFDCTANRPGYIFADYYVNGYSGTPLHDGDDCTNNLHTNFGEISTNTGCYITGAASGSAWGKAAHTWVGGQFAVNRAISNCVGENLDCSYAAHFDKLYDVSRR